MPNPAKDDCGLGALRRRSHSGPIDDGERHRWPPLASRREAADWNLISARSQCVAQLMADEHQRGCNKRNRRLAPGPRQAGHCDVAAEFVLTGECRKGRDGAAGASEATVA
mmetsp:Transcript_23343/g.66343  ORF Transcript_23343/g.66343 Transcript_23343/m.66343 type:complete len:111 (-) Transcript_23343:454-786(-)